MLQWILKKKLPRSLLITFSAILISIGGLKLIKIFNWYLPNFYLIWDLCSTKSFRGIVSKKILKLPKIASKKEIFCDIIQWKGGFVKSLFSWPLRRARRIIAIKATYIFHLRTAYSRRCKMDIVNLPSCNLLLCSMRLNQGPIKYGGF